MQPLPFRGLAAAVKEDASWITIYMYQGKDRQCLLDAAVTLEEVNILGYWLLLLPPQLGSYKGLESPVCLNVAVQIFEVATDDHGFH